MWIPTFTEQADTTAIPVDTTNKYPIRGIPTPQKRYKSRLIEPKVVWTPKEVGGDKLEQLTVTPVDGFKNQPKFVEENLLQVTKVLESLQTTSPTVQKNNFRVW
jgi:hypothetical protein